MLEGKDGVEGEGREMEGSLERWKKGEAGRTEL